MSSLFQFQFTPESSRKRKERGSISEELQKLEPSPVKRKYGDRKSSSDEGSLVEMLLVNETSYISEEDSDYVPRDNDVVGETDEELTQSDEEEIAKEAEDLKLDLKHVGFFLFFFTSFFSSFSPYFPFSPFFFCFAFFFFP